MAFIDIFATIVFLVSVLAVIAVIVVLGMAPGHIARRRGIRGPRQYQLPVG